MGLNKLLGQKSVNILNIVLIAVFVLLVLLFAREMISSYFGEEAKDEVKPAESSVPGKAVEKRAFSDYAPVLESNVFGFNAGELTLLSGKKAGFANAERTGARSAKLKLLGVVSWLEGVGYAFISGLGRGQEVYKTGDYIQTVGYLRRVETDKVIIETGAGEEELPIADISLAKSSPAPKRVNGMAKRTSKNTYELDKELVQGSLDSPKNIMTDARLLPNVVNGVQKGFVVREVKRGGIYHNLGVRNGDVLLRVNEFDISDAETALQAFSALRGLDRVDLDILRRGDPLTLTYTLK
jgi:general secretion pathway protein C